MSRIAKKPVTIPSGVEVTLNDEQVQVKGQLGNLTLARHVLVNIARGEGGSLEFAPADGSRQAKALSGTLRQLVNNMVVGVSQGFEKKLELRGVGYRAAASGQQLNLSVGYSHPVSFDMPAGITAATPTPTEIILKGADRQAVGQLAAVIRAVRPPEPYKGKGIRYAGEVVIMKETKKK